MPKPVFNPAKEIPDLSSKVIVITGGTAGLGYETVLSFAGHGPAHIFFTGRSQTSADKLIKEAKSKFHNSSITFVQCDQASLASVQEATRQILSKTDRIHILNANAGVMALPPSLTKDGYEMQFGTNHVGHALLIKLLLPTIESTVKMTGDARIIINTSLGYAGHPKGGIRFEKLKTTEKDIYPIGGDWFRYAQSKLANLLYARSLAKHYPAITTVSVHPGVSETGLVSSLSWSQRLLVHVTNIGNMITPEQCAWNQQWAATAPIGNGNRQVQSGTYYEPVGIKGRLRGESGNDDLAERLWDWTQKELEGYTL